MMAERTKNKGKLGGCLGILALLILAGLGTLGGEIPDRVSAAPAKPVEAEEPVILELEQTWSAVLPYEQILCADHTLEVGKQRVLVPGVEGEVLCRERVTYVDGGETRRQLLEERVTRQPVTEVVAYGCDRSNREPEREAVPVIGPDSITLPTGEVLTYDRMIVSLATAYCDKGLTATGTQARVGAIAVDPRVIPYGTRMFIISADGEYIYGIATAEDCGSKDHIYGTRIDLHMDTYNECRQFGARNCLVFFLS